MSFDFDKCDKWGYHLWLIPSGNSREKTFTHGDRGDGWQQSHADTRVSDDPLVETSLRLLSGSSSVCAWVHFFFCEGLSVSLFHKFLFPCLLQRVWMPAFSLPLCIFSCLTYFCWSPFFLSPPGPVRVPPLINLLSLTFVLFTRPLVLILRYARPGSAISWSQKAEVS